MAEGTMILGLVGNPNKTLVGDVLTDYIAWLKEEEIDFLVSDEFHSIPQLTEHEKLPVHEIAAQADILLSFGGDGTLLNTVRLMAGNTTPILGVNIGGLGYLTVIGPRELKERTRELTQACWTREQRMVLEVRVKGSIGQGPWYALNDVVVDKGGYSRMIEIQTRVNGRMLNTLRGDGVILATPTGSTGYNLSAGGPIMEPTSRGMLFCPLNPHSFSIRPLILGPDKIIELEARTLSQNVVINVDGQVAGTMFSNQTLIVKQADFSVNLVSFEGHHFYDVLQRKLGWGHAWSAVEEGSAE